MLTFCKDHTMILALFLKADFFFFFFFSEKTFLGILFKKQLTIFQSFSTILSINLTKNAYMEIPISWPLTYFAEYIPNSKRNAYLYCLVLPQ